MVTHHHFPSNILSNTSEGQTLTDTWSVTERWMTWLLCTWKNGVNHKQ